MNLSCVLSWDSSVSSSLSLTKAHELRNQRPSELRDPKCMSSSNSILCRSSNQEARRSTAYTSSNGGRSSNGANFDPRVARKQSGENGRNPEGSSKDLEKSSDSKFRNKSKNSASDSRGSGRRYGHRSSGAYGAGRRDREKKIHSDAYKMRDELTGELIVVWGTNEDDIPVPTAADLDWKKTKMALPGEASEEAWVKLLEDSSDSSGSFAVKGVPQGGRYLADDIAVNYPEDEFLEYEDFSDGDDNSDSDMDEGRTGVPQFSISRPPRVKVFGRDLWGRAQPKVKTPGKKDGGASSESVMNSKVLQSSQIATHGVSESQKEDTYGHEESETSSDFVVKCDSLPLIGNVIQENIADVQREDLLDEVGSNVWHTGGSASLPEEIEEGQVRAAKHDNSDAEYARTRSLIGNNNSTEVLSSASENEDFVERTSSPSKLDVGFSGEGSMVYGINDNPVQGRRVVKVVEEAGSMVRSSDRASAARERALKSKDDVRRKVGKASHSTFNPDILDISDKDENRYRHKHEHDERGSGLLDQLRLQVTGRKLMADDVVVKGIGKRTEEVPSFESESDSGDKQSSSTSVDNIIRPSIRDRTSRENYDSSIADKFFSRKSFKDVGATSEVIQALSYLQVQRPSQIQALAFKPVLDGRSCIIAEQTGSGKTLAYAAPIVQCLKEEEARTLGKSLSKEPRVLVLVPTGELAAQVLSVFRSLSKGGLACRSVVITGGFKWKTQVESLEGGADVVVATPGRLLQHLEAGSFQFNNLKSVVLDEVDILFDDEDFSKALQTINRAASIGVQYVHVTATLPVDIHDNLLERYPDCLSLMGPSLHRTAVGLQEVLVDCSGGETDERTPESAFRNKRRALLQLIEERPVSKTIIFCNKVETCRKVENVLSRYDRSGKKITVLPYHAALSQEVRLESLERFMKPPAKEHLFLVCTDRASRGIDSLDVEHVVLFDFPRDPSEYVRRVGRTARGAGGTGKVFVFVVGRQVGEARKIMVRNDKGEPVHDVPGSRYYYSN